jgi:rod shape-determining protein MreD
MMRTLRLLLFLVVVVIVQVTVFPHLRWFGVVPDLGLLVAIAVGYREGPEAGALVGFVAGLGYDLFLETPLGFCALAYALVGYSMGMLQAGMLRSPRWLPPFLGAAGGFAGGLVLLTIGTLVGVDAVKGTHGFVTISLAALYDMILAPVVFFLVSKVLPERRPSAITWTVR